MHRALALLVLTWAVIGCQSEPTKAATTSPSTVADEPNYAPGDYYVDHIVDGDTLWLRKDNETIKVRLLRVDAPEKDEFGYKNATDELQHQVGDESKIQLEFEEERKDDFGRTLAYLFVDGKNVNLEMVRTGWSPYFDRYGKGRYEGLFEDAELEAKRNKTGIWVNR